MTIKATSTPEPHLTRYTPQVDTKGRRQLRRRNERVNNRCPACGVLYRVVVVDGVGTDFVRDGQAECNAALGEAVRALLHSAVGRWLGQTDTQANIAYLRQHADMLERDCMLEDSALWNVIADVLEKEGQGG